MQWNEWLWNNGTSIGSDRDSSTMCCRQTKPKDVLDGDVHAWIDLLLVLCPYTVLLLLICCTCCLCSLKPRDMPLTVQGSHMTIFRTSRPIIIEWCMQSIDCMSASLHMTSTIANALLLWWTLWFLHCLQPSVLSHRFMTNRFAMCSTFEFHFSLTFDCLPIARRIISKSNQLFVKKII